MSAATGVAPRIAGLPEGARPVEAPDGLIKNDDFLKLPSYVHNKYMTDDRRYCSLTSKQMTRWKYWIVANFYVTAFVFHPPRVFRILFNFLRGKETSKMESFLQETMRKFRLRKKPQKGARPPANKATPKTTAGKS